MADSIFNLDAIRKAFSNVTGKPLNAAPITKPSTTTSSATATVSPSVIQTAANNVKKNASTVPSSSNITAAAQKMASTVPSSSSSTTPRTEQTLNNLSSLVNKDWQYDSNSDQALQAAIKQAQAQLAVNQKNTNAQLMATGQGKSSYSETVANQLANQASESIANDLIPTYAAQAYQQYQDSITNNQNLYNLQYNQDYTTPLNEAQVTGTYLPTEAKTAIQNILALKQQAEASGTTATERAQLSAQADTLRSQLKALGIDPSAYGADKTAAQASTAQTGIRTLAGQSQDLATRQQDNSEKQWSEEFAYQKARDSITDKQWQTTFDENVRQFGLNYALNKLQETNSAAYQQAQVALAQDDNSRAWAQLDYDQSQATSNTQGMTASQLLDNMKSLYSEPVLDSNGTDTGKTKITTNSTKRTQMFESVVDAGLSDTETKQVLLSLGFTSSEINDLIKSYPGE